MAERRTAAGDPFAMNPWGVDPWTRTMTAAFRYWLSFWPVAPLFGVEWRFAEMGHAPDPLKAAKRREAAEAPVAEVPAVSAEAAGEPDDLTRIKGIGPGVARQLEALGIRSFRQIAALSEAELAAVDEKLTSIKGRCFRDDWIGQARVLAG